ncbi:hypothetical protein OG302_19850 [Streptomyces sp. NBC_01283]|uniref:LppU/SCO3897 family protein n=1 Tax=Streptomyces sp. NBC_01283 TaxID=2903812 RepID=UPI00352EE58F|nr:hypothetical protein OG302_19850 [Streptomyces sp. NBC_01283]
MPEPIRPVPPAPRPAPTPGSTARGCLVSLGAIGAVVIVILLLTRGNDDSDDNAAPTSTTSQSAYTYTPSTSTPYTNDPYDTGTDTAAPAATPTSEAPTPFTSGTCLNGTLPDSETAQEVSNVDEVSCSASDAHYEVIETIPLTSDMSRCDNNPKTQYAFSYRYTLNGSTINEYVYCLIGLGPYAR